MGASKRCSELVLQALAAENKPNFISLCNNKSDLDIDIIHNLQW